MEYEGLSQDDLANVTALNRAWLQLNRDSQRRLPGQRLERLAATPFLLFSFREQDDAWWSWLLGDRRQQDILARQPVVTGELRQLQAAGLGFLWELARRNAYVARIVSGAPLTWCEQIGTTTFVRLLDCARFETIEPRFARGTAMHRCLLRQGGASERNTRDFAQIAALQSVLTSGQAEQYGRLPAAACRMQRSARQVADKL